ncbi:MurR/RpiR family transcriptional regulator [Mesorhizobium sp. M00.F.Ca.ET.216.01.1.1]|uniref:MurR/RpiR family transcriptional regulator n=1 Tax=Mesorhizobium sp. M00.F.Ca.ET.216.01.1.1 TaxID=2500528 RepID=UPI000FDC1FBF|nr:MurR/RpiR family transcriptional regulator [Mesorhizobium sp. M00.F.Ca.ET.216.01.1.1]TGQ38384.1 MurR/RpiR family transcriptional regulator [Mesorhizobium sp. M00.F.Ca.ET.216.01.1.1]
MDQGELAEQIVNAFDGMSAQIQSAARYVLDKPHDVALLTMREQARQAGVQPATMTRLAQHLGLDGYETVREIYAAAIRGGEIGFAGKAGVQVASQKLKGDHALAIDILHSISGQVAYLAESRSIDRLVATARALTAARRVYCLGLRSSHAVAWHLHYILSLIGEKSILLHGIGGTEGDALRSATKDDVLIAASVLPYTRFTIELVEFAASRGVPVVAVTDSEVAPLAQLADHLVLVPTGSPSFFHTMTPAFIVSEILGALVAGQAGDSAVEALRRFDEQGVALNTHLNQRPPRKVL